VAQNDNIRAIVVVSLVEKSAAGHLEVADLRDGRSIPMKMLQFGDSACERMSRYMDSYISNELLVETNHEVLRHLETCPSCAAELEARARLRTRLKAAVASQPVPAGLDARLRESLRNQNSRSWSSTPWVRWGAAAAVLVIGLAVWSVRPWGRQPLLELADRHGQDIFIQNVSHNLASSLKIGLGDHIHCSVFRKYPKNPPTVDEMAAKLGPTYKELVPILKARVPGEFRILLAHQCSYLGRRFVHVTLSNGSHLLSLVITVKQPGESLEALTLSDRALGVAVYQSVAQDYDVAAFETDRYLAYVISDLGGKQNLRIAESLAPQLHDFLAAIRG
jgi:hypothetical protein